MHRTYIVRRGDTLHRIASRYGTSLSRLIQLNPQVTRPDMIFPGERIQLR